MSDVDIVDLLREEIPLADSVLGDQRSVAADEIERLRVQLDLVTQQANLVVPQTLCGVEIFEASKIILAHKSREV